MGLLRRPTLGLFAALLAASAGRTAFASDVPCTPGYERAPLVRCTANASGRALLELVEMGPPAPLPPVEVEPLPPPQGSLKLTYARVTQDELLVYRHPAEALDGRPPVRSLGTGFVFVSVEATTTYRDQAFVQINAGEFVRAEALSEAAPSRFHGTVFATPPAARFGWVIANFQLRRSPGADARPDDPWLPRYALFQVYGAQRVGDWTWYMVGPEQWIEQRQVAIASATPPIAVPGRLIAVDIYEQTLVAYQDGQPVFATLISSGIAAESTPPGLYQVYARLNHGRMSGAYLPDGSDYYYLEDVPNILYFDGDRALHGAYWHDAFGTKRSHGCVNLSPSDSRWLFDWAPSGTPVLIFHSAG